MTKPKFAVGDLVRLGKTVVEIVGLWWFFPEFGGCGWVYDYRESRQVRTCFEDQIERVP